MQLRDYLVIVRRRWRSMVMVILLTLIATFAITAVLPKRYTASTQMLFDVQSGGPAAGLNEAFSFVESRMPSYAEVATSPLILDPVISDLGLSTSSTELMQDVSAVVPEGTVILDISVTYDSAQTASEIANGIAAELVSRVSTNLAPKASANVSAVQTVILAEASPGASTSSPNVARSMGFGLVLALLLAFSSVALRHALDMNIRSEADVRALTDSAVVGVIPFDTKVPARPLVMESDPFGTGSEAIRRLRTNVLFLRKADRTGTTVITSSVPQEGRTTTAVNLGLSLADTGLKVLLIDADLRRPSVAQFLGLVGTSGLTTVLSDEAPVDDVVQQWKDTTFHVLAAGPVPSNPSEMLGSRAMSELLQRLCSSYDVVLLDTPPLLLAADAVVLGRTAGNTLVVVGMDCIHRTQLRAALESLTMVGASILGLVLNRVPPSEMGPFIRNSDRLPGWVLTNEGPPADSQQDVGRAAQVR